MRYAYISSGSNTTIKAGPGDVHSLVVGGANGGTVCVVDAVGIGAAPNLVTQRFATNNIAYIGGLPVSPIHVSIGAHFVSGLTIAATSSPSITVIYD